MLKLSISMPKCTPIQLYLQTCCVRLRATQKPLSTIAEIDRATDDLIVLTSFLDCHSTQETTMVAVVPLNGQLSGGSGLGDRLDPGDDPNDAGTGEGCRLSPWLGPQGPYLRWVRGAIALSRKSKTRVITARSRSFTLALTPMPGLSWSIGKRGGTRERSMAIMAR